MPKGCLLFSNEVMHRDFFMCNPTNTGHYQYPKFETLSYDTGCHRREVNKFLERNDPDRYVIFYTRHTDYSGNKKNKIIGYFKVGKQFEKPKGFHASEHVLLAKDGCFEINYHSKGIPVSWGNSSIKNDVNNILKNLKTKQTVSIADKYQKQTQGIMNRLRRASGRKEIIDICEGCGFKGQCYWGKKAKQDKERKLKKLYGSNQVC